MKKIIPFFLGIVCLYQADAQNLIINPDAESLPRGTGWTIISQGTYACTPIPTNTFLNWTLIPDGTLNYPFDHTTGAAGGTIFYAGCSDFVSGVKELQQTINVSADAATIDAGTQLYTFSGYIQTPVDNQTDRGRFIIDYLNAANAVLGSSYTTPWQSFFDGSGTAWKFYTDTRLAPANTRKINIRLQAELFNNRYAINVYFDDISLTKPSVVPVRILSFSGTGSDGYVHLKWDIASELNLDRYELERSRDAVIYNRVTTMSAGRTRYEFTDDVTGIDADQFFYRLKMTDLDGKFTYSEIVPVKTRRTGIVVLPNPANEWIRVSGTLKKGLLTIRNASGTTVLTTPGISSTTSINISTLPPGIYFVRYMDGSSSQVKKLVVQ
jgi:hypothetical protein